MNMLPRHSNGFEAGSDTSHVNPGTNGNTEYANRYSTAVDSKPGNQGGPNGVHEVSRKPKSAEVYHAVNPCRTTWSNLLPTIKAHFDNISLETVSLKEWVQALNKSATNTEDIHANPGIRLLDFYNSLLGCEHNNPIFETTNTTSKSEELAGLEAIKPEWMKLWLEQWDF